MPATKPTVLGLADDLAAGRTTSRALVEAALARIGDPAGEGCATPTAADNRKRHPGFPEKRGHFDLADLWDDAPLAEHVTVSMDNRQRGSPRPLHVAFCAGTSGARTATRAIAVIGTWLYSARARQPALRS